MDKHAIAALLIGKPMHKSSGPVDDEAPDDNEKVTVSSVKAHSLNMAHEFMDAIRESDAHKLSQIFSSWHELDHSRMDKEGSGEKEEPEEDLEPDEASEQ